jgi:hypothetical protein
MANKEAEVPLTTQITPPPQYSIYSVHLQSGKDIMGYTLSRGVCHTRSMECHAQNAVVLL